MVWRGAATKQTRIFGQTLRDAALLSAYGVARKSMMPEASYPPRSLSANKKSGVATAGDFVKGSNSNLYSANFRSYLLASPAVGSAKSFDSYFVFLRALVQDIFDQRDDLAERNFSAQESLYRSLIGTV